MAKERILPRSSPAGERAKADRQARLGRALRENLRRRKAQKQGRDPAAGAVETGTEGGEALESGSKVK